MQSDGVLFLHTTREGELEVPCTGYVREVVLTSGSKEVIGDVTITQQSDFLLEASVAALTEHMAKQTPAVYKGTFYPSQQEGEGRSEHTERKVRFAAVAGKDLRFTTEAVDQ